MVEPLVPVEQSTAVHEAGHAVMGYLLHRPIYQVCAVRSAERNSYTDFRPTRINWEDNAVSLTRHGRRWLWDYTTIALAGTLTQTLLYPNTPTGSGAPDIRRAEKLSLRACSDDRERAVSYASSAAARVKAYHQQDRFWQLLEALSAALMSEGIVTGYKARQMLLVAEQQG